MIAVALLHDDLRQLAFDLSELDLVVAAHDCAPESKCHEQPKGLHSQKRARMCGVPFSKLEALSHALAARGLVLVR